MSSVSSAVLELSATAVHAQLAIEHYEPTYRGNISLLTHSENVTYRVGAGPRRYVLRVHREGYHTREAIVRELWWLEALVQSGLDVIVPVRGMDGELVQCVTHAELGSRYVVLFHWMDRNPCLAIHARQGQTGAVIC